MEVTKHRNIYVFSKLPLDDPGLDMYASDQQRSEERYDSNIGNKYFKYFMVPLDNISMIFIIKYNEKVHSMPIPNVKNFVFYLSKKRMPRIIKPPKNNSLKWLEEFESGNDYNDSDFDVCYNFIKINNIFTKSFCKNCTSQFQSFLFEYRNINFFVNDEISNYSFKVVNYYQSKVINEEEISKFQLKFLLKISSDFFNHSLMTPFALISFFLNKQKVEIEPLRVDSIYNDSFTQFKELFYHSITTFGIPFIFWIYTSKLHDEIIKEYEKLEGQIKRIKKNSNAEFSESLNYSEIIQIIELKFKHFDQLLNSSDFNSFLKFTNIFFNEQFTSQNLINGLKNIEFEKLEFIKMFYSNENQFSFNKIAFKKDFLFDNDYASIINEYKGIPCNESSKIKSANKIAKSDGLVILKKREMKNIKSKQKQNILNQNINEKLNDKMADQIDNDKNFFQLSLLEHHAVSFSLSAFDIPEVPPKNISKSDGIIIKKRKKIVLNQSNSNKNLKTNSDGSSTDFYHSNNNSFNSNSSSNNCSINLKNIFSFNSNSNNPNQNQNNSFLNQNNANLNSNSNNPNQNQNNSFFNQNNANLNSNSNIFAFPKNSNANLNDDKRKIEISQPKNSSKSDNIVIQIRKPKKSEQNDSNKPTIQKAEPDKVSIQKVNKSDGIVIQKRSKPPINIQISGNQNKE